LGIVRSPVKFDRPSNTIKTANVELAMTLVVVAEPAPLETNADGVVRVGKTPVTLDTIIAVFKQGTTAEEIVYRYPSRSIG
jgi:hypothetical protein